MCTEVALFIVGIRLRAVKITIPQVWSVTELGLIIETLNARGTPLTAADLIKNFVFQKLEQEGVDTEKAYAEEWPFERNSGRREIGVGRYNISRSSLFFNQWLGSLLGEEISPKSTFTRFKSYVEHESGQKISQLLGIIRQQADRYEAWTMAADDPDRDLNRSSSPSIA